MATSAGGTARRNSRADMPTTAADHAPPTRRKWRRSASWDTVVCVVHRASRREPLLVEWRVKSKPTVHGPCSTPFLFGDKWSKHGLFIELARIYESIARNPVQWTEP